MAVKLHCAYNNVGQLVFIRDRLKNSPIYYCPHCREEVFPKKGAIREHHFSHKPNTECSASYETILHFEAKHYLADQIPVHDGERIEFPFDLGKHIPVLEILKKEAGISDHSIVLLSEIIAFYGVMGAFKETTIPGSKFIADVIGVDREGNKVLIFEIFVSHESEREKIDYLMDKQIPYLEVIPFRNEKGEIQFKLHSYYLPWFFERYKENVDTTMMEQLYPFYKDELNRKAERLFEEEEILKLKLLAVQSLKKELQTNSIYSELIGSLDLHSYSTRAIAHKATIKRSEQLEQLSSRRKGNETYLIGQTTKDSYLVSNAQNQLYSIINQLITQINISALIGGWENSKKDTIVGFEFGIPQPSELSEAVREVLLNRLEDYERRFKNKLKSEPTLPN